MTGWCEFCHQYGSHLSQCPNWEPRLSNHICEMCKEPIADGEVYIRNFNDEYMHYDCVDKDDVIKLLDGEVGTMEVNDD